MTTDAPAPIRLARYPRATTRAANNSREQSPSAPDSVPGWRRPGGAGERGV